MLPIIRHFIRPSTKGVAAEAAYVYAVSLLVTVLKRFTKRIDGFGNQSYDVRLKALNEHSLESRRIRADLIRLCVIKCCMD